MLGAIGNSRRRACTVLIRQQEIDLIEVDQLASLLSASHPKGTVTGRVVEVAASPTSELPEGFATNDLDESETYYQARVVFDGNEKLTVGAVSRIKITARKTSLISRIRRQLEQTFR